jgi:glyoxylase-like metal-dependent hydrolase (beta-lactamase superfamily II)
MRASDIKRIHYGYFVAPEGYPDAGQPVPVTGFVIPDRAGTILFDTGFSPFEDDVRQRYHPRSRPAREALAASGVDPDSITAIVNCHMHSDHSGGNHEFPGVPIYVQAVELDNARTPDFTYPLYTCDFDGAVLEVIEGEMEMRPGIRIVPTPGHTSGHQALLVSTDEGVLMMAGQAADPWRFSSATFGERIDHEIGDRIGEWPDWASLLRERNVFRAYLSHDLMIWERDDSPIGRPVVR